MNMALNLESCSVREMCESLGGSEKLLNDLRERLKDWLKLQPHLPQDVPKEMLDHFILGTKMSLEQAKRKLDMFYTMKRLVPEFLGNRDPRGPGLTCLHTFERIVYLPKLTPNKHRVFICHLIHSDCSKINSSDFFKYAIMIDELLSITARDLGNIYIFDQSNLSLSFLAKHSPTMIKKSEVVLTEAHARSVKGIHFINAIPVTNTLLTLAKTVLKPKLAARIHVHSKGSYESLHQHIPKSILPKDYGGDERSMAELAELWRSKVDEKRDWFLEQDKIFVDERLRPGPAVNADNLFGFSGSFRKLDVD